MKKSIITIILLMAATTILFARDFKEYKLGTNVEKYIELSFCSSSDTGDIYSSDEMSSYCGISTPTSGVISDTTGFIISKFIRVEDKSDNYATTVWKIWFDRLKAVYGTALYVSFDGRPLSNKSMIDAELNEFQLSGNEFNIVFKSGKIITSLLMTRYEADYLSRYDVSVLMMLSD